MPALQKAGLEIVFNQEYPADIKDMTGLLSGVKYLQIQKGIAQIIWPAQVKTSNFQPKGPWK